MYWKYSQSSGRSRLEVNKFLFQTKIRFKRSYCVCDLMFLRAVQLKLDRLCTRPSRVMSRSDGNYYDNNNKLKDLLLNDFFEFDGITPILSTSRLPCLHNISSQYNTSRDFIFIVDWRNKLLFIKKMPKEKSLMQLLILQRRYIVQTVKSQLQIALEKIRALPLPRQILYIFD